MFGSARARALHSKEGVGPKMITLLKRVAQVLTISLAASSLLAAAADAQTLKIVPERAKPAFPQLSFTERHLSGQAAVDKLGSRLPDVANWYGKSAEQLRRQLLTDRDVRIDNKGRMFVVEEMEAPLPGASFETQQSLMQGQLMGLDQTFLLHSRPGALRTIYLDFNGATITGTAWNSNNNTITAKAYDLDGNAGAFSTTEMQRIQYIWQRVAEDYAPFDVDVTTEAPTADRLTRSDSNDQTFGTTVVITDNNGVYSCNCGGIAYVGVFNDNSSYYKPALVFFNMLGSGDEKAVAEAISHEAGHNMGLSHDGSPAGSYYTGQGTDGVTGWAPIMGVGYYKPVVQFSRGEYAGANNTEDDFAVAQSNGLPLRADDYGNATSNATPLPGSGGGTMDGVIERAGDADMFSFAAAAGNFNASLTPANRSANADLVLTLLNGAGQELASSNPMNALNAALSYQIPAAGTYYIRVTATGQGDPAVTGYSAYGSVGNYRVAASYQSGGTPPVAVISASATSGIAPAAITLDASQSTDADGSVQFYYWDFGDGTGDSSGSLRTANKNYSTPGNYTARLTVVDDKGFSASTTQLISISSAIPVKEVKIQSINISLGVSRRGVGRAKSTIVVVNQLGQVVRNAVISASWSGVVTSTAARRSSRAGRAFFVSPGTTTLGCYTLTITNIALTGYTVDQASLPTTQVCR
jgi:hypothetical protein